MAYRALKPDLKKAPGPRYVNNGATPAKIYVANGTAINYAFPVWYVEIPNAIVAYHRIDRHDNWGWPNPMRVDKSCQIGPVSYTDPDGFANIFPVHLTEEGYTSVDVFFADKANGVTATAAIDETDDWVIRVNFTASVPDVTYDQIDFPFSIVVNNPETGAKDMAMRGVLVVLPAPITK